MLELVEDELGDEKGALQESRLRNIRNTAVDDDARVQDLRIFIRRLTFRMAFRKEAPSLELYLFSLFEPDPEADISTDPVESAKQGQGDLLVIRKIG